MIERHYFDLTKLPVDADAVCVTTNGMTRNNGNAVMGAGIAKAFAEKYPNIPKILGEKLRKNGNHTQEITTITPIGRKSVAIVSFPTKNDWRNDSDIDLITRSAKELKKLADQNKWERVYLPRPGCACGKLSWVNVKPIINNILDSRFIVTWR